MEFKFRTGQNRNFWPDSYDNKDLCYLMHVFSAIRPNCLGDELGACLVKEMAPQSRLKLAKCV